MGALGATSLTPEEAQLVYNLEVIGLPLGAAARTAGCPLQRAVLPHVIAARALLKRELAKRMALTREDAVEGIRDAIHDAKLLADPTAQIKGWQAIAEMMGWNAPKKIDVEHSGLVEITQKNIRQLSDEELVKRLDASDVIDADFYPVDKQ